MSMEEWPDDHLDELFRKSAEEFDIPFNSDDWTDMSRRLDEHDRHTMFDRISRWGGITALVLLLLGGLGWIMYDEKPTGTHQQPTITVLTPARKSVAQPAGINQPEKAANVSSSTKMAGKSIPIDGPKNEVSVTDNAVKKDPTTTSNSAGQATTKETNRRIVELPTGKTTRSVNEPLVNRSAERSASREKVRVSDKRVVKPTDERIADVSNSSTAIDVEVNLPAGQRITQNLVTKPSRLRTDKPIKVERPVSLNTSARRGTDVPVQAVALHQNPDGNVPGIMSKNQPDRVAKASGTNQTAVTDLVTDTQWLPALTPATSLSRVVQQAQETPEPTPPQVIVTAPVSPAMPKLTGLSVLLFASPDLSGIGLTNFDRPGTNAGISIQYQLTDRLSINAGAMYSTKRYQTYSNEYVWPSYMNMEVWPEEISGVCKMIDVPLNVRYDWLLRRRGDGRAPARWFASAGLTSYFIQHEVYSYEYANPANPKIRSWGWDNQKAGRAGGSFGFSNLNVSIGYERPITNRLSWQVEPFMKVPLKQVGYFKIRLLSTGAFVGLRYRF